MSCSNWCGNATLAGRSCAIGVHLTRYLKYTEKGEVKARGLMLLHHNRYVWQYYSECCKRDVQVHNLENRITKLYFNRNLLILENFSPQYFLAIR